MKYYLVHITYAVIVLGEEVLIKEYSRRSGDGSLEVKARKQSGGTWRIGGGWLKVHGSGWAGIKEAMKNGTHERDGLRFEARELTEEEAAMILFRAERVYD